MTSFERLFAPTSVAVVGASSNPDSFASRPLAYLARYQGRLYAVNPRHAQVDGVTSYPSVSALPEVPDIAYVLVPARAAVEIVEECARIGVPFVVISTSGFAEVQGGEELQARISELASQGGTRILGPNCEGLWNVEHGLFLTFGSAAARNDIKHGGVSILSQSGSVASGLAQRLLDEGIGIDLFITTGNEADVDAIELLEAVIERPSTHVIALFVEGFRNGRRIVDVGRRALRAKRPIVVLKAGVTDAALAAIATHTGKIVSRDSVYDAAFQQAGMVRVDTVGELEQAVHAFLASASAGQGPAILSISGGSRALFVDAAAAHEVEIPTYQPSTRNALAELLPPYATLENPADITGEAQRSPELIATLANVVARDPSCGFVIVQMAGQGRRLATDVGTRLAPIVAGGKPVVLSFIAGLPDVDDRRQLRASGLILASEPAAAIQAISWLSRHQRHANRAAPTSEESVALRLFDPRLRDPWRLLDAVGVATVTRSIAHDTASLDAALEVVGFPCVMKAVGDELAHKSEVGGVRYAATREEAQRHLTSLLAIPATRAVELQAWVSDAVEALVSVRRDPDMGPTLHLAPGGVLVELTGLVSTRLLPVTNADIDDMLEESRLAPLLGGYRGAPKRDTPALKDLLRAVCGLIEHHRQLVELELNPVMVRNLGMGACVVDALARFEDD